MVNSTTNYTGNPAVNDPTLVEPSHTVTSWGAIIGGAVGAAAISLILLTLGSALGLSFGSSVHGSAPSKAHILGFSAIAWLIVMQWISSGFGGYLAGRLRTRWIRIDEEECYFRDTAHGFLAWAIATLLTASLLSSATTSLIHGGMHAAMIGAEPKGAVAGPANGPSPMVQNNGPFAYYIDGLFRSNNANATVTPDVKMEADRIIMTDLKNGDVTSDDRAYLTHLVSARTGLSQVDASTRVDTVLAQIKDAQQKAKDAADAARKAAATLSFFTFFSLLIGAFIASVAGAIGGHHRKTY